ncbi:hypothetical protein [Fodinibius halophilus]|uniref:Uncharacterized protein n=1 Tax=Fodinibius halophilus TaxID=1736908 RepID=A0A6M1T753_9BACT|nr:hypothetical protein [Fodinibius halophilus]NGP89939.1 hypothetical protein [Fodinibius halophilus]
MKRLVILLIISVLLNCENTKSPVQPKIGEEFTIEYGQEITIPEEGITLRFNDVLTDSRCPQGVSCIWLGNAEIVIELNDTKANLNTLLEPNQVRFSEYKVQFLSLKPYPKHDVELENKDYFAKLLISKN